MADSSATALLKQLGAFLFIPFSFLFFKEDKFSVKKIIALLCGIGGIAALNVTADGFSLGTGEILVICASFCGVISSIMSKKSLQTIDPIALTGTSQLFGGIVLTVLGLSLGGGIQHFSIKSALVFLYICTASIVGYCLWNVLLKLGDLSELLILKFTEPVFAAIFGAILLSEDIFNIRFACALILTTLGIIVTNFKQKSRL
jgi:drug/metabolite transporter (DMT)-like permease